MPTLVLSDAEKKELCARIAYEASREYLSALGDASLAPWRDAAESHKEKVRTFVAATLAGGRARALGDEGIFKRAPLEIWLQVVRGMAAALGLPLRTIRGSSAGGA